MNKKILIIILSIVVLYVLTLTWLMIFGKPENNSTIDHAKIPSSSYVSSELQSNDSEFIDNFEYESVNISEPKQAELQFIDALLLKDKVVEGDTKEMKISTRSAAFPLVNNTASWLAFKHKDDTGHESVAIVSLDFNRFGEVEFLSSKKSEEGFGGKVNTTVLEYSWDLTGNNILYSLAKSDVDDYQITIYSVNEKAPQNLYWKDRKQYRSNFCYVGLGKFNFIYCSKEGLCQPAGTSTTGLDDKILVRGDIFEPIYVHSMNKIYYYKYDNNDAGIYENTVNGQNEKKIVNLPVFSEICPKISEQFNILAFLSNYDRNFKGSTQERDELRNRFGLYTSGTDQLKNTASLRARDYVNVQTFRDIQFRNKNIIKWLGSKLFFLYRDAPDKIGYWDSSNNDQRFYELNKVKTKPKIIDLPFWNADKKYSSLYNYSFEIAKINSFDVFQRDRRNYLVVSASVFMEIKHTEDSKLIENIPDVIILLYEF
ncbi:hypothetical protein GMMP15_180029 [Candidatus Magnetomoraceae bacterium gMMP-15]